MPKQCHEYFEESQLVSTKNPADGRRDWIIAHRPLAGMLVTRRLSCHQNYPPPSAFFIYSQPLKYRTERKGML